MDLEAAFDTIAPPEAQQGPPLYSVIPISGLRSYLVGKDQAALACVLIATADDTTTVQAPIRLETIDVQFDLRCQLRKGADAPSEGVFTVIRCRSADRETIRYFLSVCRTVIKLLGDRPTRRAVASAVNRLVDIFRRAQALASRSVSGLFGELYVISRSKNLARSVAAWRMAESARFDFVSNDARLEVKAATGRKRIHSFSYEQCNPPAGTVAVIASLLVERIAGGMSLRSLVEQIERELAGNADLVLKLREVVASTMGGSLHEALTSSFDMRLAETSLRFFRCCDIPAIRGQLPPGVSDVHFTADLSGLDVTSLQHLIQQSADLEELLPADT
jgi:hypothetical protein